MANAVYNKFKADLAKGVYDFESNTFYAMLVTSSYVLDVDSHEYRDDITDEVTGTGYTSAGVEITNIVVSQDNTNDKAVIDADNISWESSTITAKGLIVYKYTGAASTDNLVCYIDFGENKSTSNTTFAITWNSQGILNIY